MDNLIKFNVCLMSLGMEALAGAGIGMAVQEGMEALGAGIDAAFKGAKLKKQWKKGVQNMMQNTAATNYYNPNGLDINNPAAAFSNIDNIDTTINSETILGDMGMNSFLLGGIIGNLTSNAFQRKYEKKAEQLAPQIMAMRENEKNNAIFGYQQDLNNARTFHAEGGFVAKSPYNVFSGGYKHEDIVPFGNQDRGIAQGISNDGTKNVVETGEVIDRENSYVISNSKEEISKEYGGWLITKEDAIKYDLPKWTIGKSPAEASKKIVKLAEDRGNADPISNETTRKFMDRMESLNEEKRIAQQLTSSLSASKDEYKTMMSYLKNNKLDINEILAQQQAIEEQQQAVQQQNAQTQNFQSQITEDSQYSAFGGFTDNKVTFTDKDVKALGLPKEFIGQDIKDVISTIPQTQENLEMINKLMSLYKSKKQPIGLQIPLEEDNSEYWNGGFLKNRRAVGLTYKDVKNLGRRDLINAFKNKKNVEYNSTGHAEYKGEVGDELKSKVNRLVDRKWGKNDDIKSYSNLQTDKDGNIIAGEDADKNVANRELQDYQALLNSKQIAKQNKQNRLAELIPTAASTLFPAIALALNNKNFGDPDTNLLRNLATPSKKLNYTPVGNYIKFNLPNYGDMLARINKNTRTASSELYNSNQNPGALNAANLALHNQANSKLGETLINISDDYNKILGNQATFNLGIDQNNAKHKLSVDMANIDSDLKYQGLLSDNWQRADLMDASKAARKEEGFFGSFASLGNTLNSLIPQLTNTWIANNSPYSDFNVDAEKKGTQGKFGGRMKSKNNKRTIKKQ